MRLAVVCVLSLLAGCWGKILVLEKGPIQAYGDKMGRETAFYEIHLNPEKSSQEELSRYFVKLSPDSQPVRVDQLTEKTVSEYLPPYLPTNEFAPVEVFQAYTGGGYWARFSGTRLVVLTLSHYQRYGRSYPVLEYPVIALREDGPFYKLPLTMAQMIEIFGQPGRLYWKEVY